MTSINRVDQAILLLRDRLKKLNADGARTSAAGTSGRSDSLAPLRQLVRQGQLSQEDLRKAFVRTLLSDSLRDELVGSLEFQSIADEVTRILEAHEAGRNLITRALAELG